MLTEICQFLRNWFELDKWAGDFAVSDGVITQADGTAISLLDNQYYRVIGSAFNDGVHKYGDEEDGLTDEPEFSGAVWPMRVPPDVVKLAEEIAAWQEKYGGVESATMSPFSSERGGGMLTNWQSLYAARLAPWRKI